MNAAEVVEVIKTICAKPDTGELSDASEKLINVCCALLALEDSELQEVILHEATLTRFVELLSNQDVREEMERRSS